MNVSTGEDAMRKAPKCSNRVTDPLIALDDQLARGQRWQRDQAWASARSVADGTAEPVTWEQLRSEHASAVTKLRRRRKTR